MRSHRFGTFFAAVAVLAAGALAPPAAADTGRTDDHAEGDWHGVATWESKPAGGIATGGGTPSLAPVPPGGTATPPSSGGSGGTVTPPSGTTDPAPVPGETDTDPTGTPAPALVPAPPFTPTPEPVNCGARWVLEVVPETPDLHTKETLLTLEIFRVDAFGFLSNGYCRSMSTWYADWFVSTVARCSRQTAFQTILRLEAPCPNCAPEITLNGISSLQAIAQTRASVGGISTGTKADASAGSTWAGDVNASDRAVASARDGSGSGTVGIDLFSTVKIQAKETDSFVLAEVIAGKGDGKTIQRNRTELWIRHAGSVTTDAAGSSDNAQAKVLGGFDLKILGVSKCGATGTYVVGCIQ
jgi:hypothetical protein